ncbi:MULTISPECIES: D-amino-acid transaminase [Rhizobium/Agrobacterium group]|uniref:Probable branched-chain-amino-acid aminotransferase n=2 Tax=Rhizobium/Agrobacterium group TaxID=227290 RepID=B9K250_ALLAM|nr:MULTISPECIES: D-amino-acid transaminase [Rhizobium/Agrobacterium group]ACM38948.1 D-alanine aminotransferase [Allorhizobium ampelinum S4]MCF1490890.1 D-amino-acid transaminase [Allorhizobium ampelinum]MUO26351.1 D-amino-acid transaminase [Agrobacterium vitis]MUO44469.1 D-amino-acid transaminase [Agrobacterium vitis]MUP12504.1 D-amino-acid transaminase [Agrobacterium vitis]
MSNPALRTVYLNGAFLAENEAHISIFDRGFLFGDGIYEVTAVLDGKLVDSALHMTRLERSVGEIGGHLPVSTDEIVEIERRLIAENGLKEGMIYLQYTRGAEDRNFLYSEDLAPTLLLFTQSKSLDVASVMEKGLRVKTVTDQRWARRDIKSVCLLPQVLAKRAAKAEACDEAWMVEDGFVTEGASSTAYIVTADDKIITRANSNATLPGCTRLALLQLAKEHGLVIEERPFSVEEALGAREAALTSASNFIVPITSIDGKQVGDGKPGPVVTRLRALYMENARKTAI